MSNSNAIQHRQEQSQMRRHDTSAFGENVSISAIKEAVQLWYEGGLLPKGVSRKAACCLAIYGKANYGLNFTEAIDMLYCVNGRIGAYTAFWIMKYKEAGHKIRTKVWDETRCQVELTLAGDTEPSLVYEFTIEDAKRAGLLNREVWRQWPKNMLYYRAASHAIRSIAPEVIRSGHTVEEIQDMPPEPETIKAEATTIETPALEDAVMVAHEPKEEREPIDAEEVTEPDPDLEPDPPRDQAEGLREQVAEQQQQTQEVADPIGNNAHVQDASEEAKEEERAALEEALDHLQKQHGLDAELVQKMRGEPVRRLRTLETLQSARTYTCGLANRLKGEDAYMFLTHTEYLGLCEAKIRQIEQYTPEGWDYDRIEAQILKELGEASLSDASGEKGSNIANVLCALDERVHKAHVKAAPEPDAFADDDLPESPF